MNTNSSSLQSSPTNSINNNIIQSNDSLCNNNNPCSPNKNLGNGLSDSCGQLNTCLTGEQPDPDYIKMFVGQVPKSMDEEQLKDMFEEFGRVHSINVLRDKATGISKGMYTFYIKKL